MRKALIIFTREKQKRDKDSTGECISQGGARASRDRTQTGAGFYGILRRAVDFVKDEEFRVGTKGRKRCDG